MKTKTIWITAGSIAAALVIGGAGIAIADPFDSDALSGSARDRASAAALAQVGDGRVTDTELSDDPDHRYEIEVTRDNLQQVDVYLDESFAIVGVDTDTRSVDRSGSASDSPDAAVDDDNLTISEAERAAASASALAQTGGGRVTELDRSDDRDHAWEVEVTLETGADIDIELDADFAVTQVDHN